MADLARRTKKRTKVIRVVVPVTVLGIDSNYEPVTQAVCEYREIHVYPYMESKGLHVTKFQGPLARRSYVAAEAKKTEVEYLTGVGHGTEDSFTGYYGDNVFQVGNYHPAEAQGKVFHFLSCRTAVGLGRDLIANGARAFFGYDEDFTFTMPEKAIFFECDSEIDNAFVDGLTAEQVYSRVLRLYDARIADLRANWKLREAATLEFDRDHLRCPSSGGTQWGNKDAKLS